MTEIIVGVLIGIGIGGAYYLGYRQAGRDLIVKMKTGEVDSCTEYGYINIEKNGKKGGIIL